MGFLGNILSAGIKVVTAPIAVVADVIDVANGEKPENTANQLGSAVEDVVKGIDELV